MRLASRVAAAVVACAVLGGGTNRTLDDAPGSSRGGAGTAARAPAAGRPIDLDTRPALGLSSVDADLLMALLPRETGRD